MVMVWMVNARVNTVTSVITELIVKFIFVLIVISPRCGWKAIVLDCHVLGTNEYRGCRDAGGPKDLLSLSCLLLIIVGLVGNA